MSYYVYKMTVDNGGAPCVVKNLLSLAICKPVIRRKAKYKDWIFGFGGKNLGGRLIYIACITDKEENGDYYRGTQYLDRSDCIYRWHNSKLVWEKGSKSHLDGHEAPKDIGKPPNYKNANVLLSKDFRYFGHKGEKLDSGEYPALTKLLARLRQGHLVNHSKPVLDELVRLKEKMWVKRKKVIGQPTHKDPSLCCSGDEGSCECRGG